MVIFSGLTPQNTMIKKMKKGFKDTKIKIKIQNKDQIGQGLDLWSCLYGFWQKRRQQIFLYIQLFIVSYQVSIVFLYYDIIRKVFFEVE